ncbi:MAG: hypothetical protein ACRDIY_21345 [Chloroflexota bacterium]
MGGHSDSRCPTCGRPRETPRVARRRELVSQIYALQREILSLEEGEVQSAIHQQTPAASCTICAQAAPGKPGQPTPSADLIRPLRLRRDALEQDLNRLDREG